MNIEIEYEGVKFNCEYDYEKEQRGSIIDPAYPPQAYISEIYVVGTEYNLLDVLSVGTVEAIEEKIVEAHQ